MRNNIKVLDPSFPRVGIRDLKSGEMFKFKAHVNADAIYMKVVRHVSPKDNEAVHLATGNLYNMDVTSDLCRVSLLQIGSAI